MKIQMYKEESDDGEFVVADLSFPLRGMNINPRPIGMIYLPCSVLSNCYFDGLIKFAIENHGMCFVMKDGDWTRKSLSELITCLKLSDSQIIQIMQRFSSFEIKGEYYE